MKLNLIPQTVNKQLKARNAWVVGILLVVSSIAGAAAMIVISSQNLKVAQDDAEKWKQPAEDAFRMSGQADTIIANASEYVRNIGLAKAVIAHNDVYPRLYEDLKPYIPPFYRVSSITPTPVSATEAQITITGTLSSYRQYADLVLALARWNEVTTVGRAGFIKDDPFVPGLSPEDQTGRPHKQSEGTVPDDELQRLAYFQAQASTGQSGFLNVGNFGSGDLTTTRGARPGDSLVTVVLTVNRNLQVPDMATTLRSGGGAAAGVAAPALPSAGAED